MGFKRKDVLTSALASGYTFTRTGTGSIASYFDSSGVMQYAAANVARFDYSYNGSAWTAKGLICEQACTNNALQSQAMSASPWGVFGTGTITANAANFPDGTTTAERFDEAAATNFHGVYTTTNPANPSGTVNFSLFVKRETVDWMMLYSLPRTATDAANESRRSFDLVNAVSGNGTAGSASHGVINCGGGWLRLWSTAPTSTSTQRELRFCAAPANSASLTSYAGTNKTFLYGGAMLHAGTFPGTYIPTVGSAVTRGIDICQITTPPVDTSQPFAMLVKYSLLPGASAGGPLVYESSDAGYVYSASAETCKVIRFNGIDTVDATEAGSVLPAVASYNPAAVAIYLGSDGSSLALNGCISEVQWWEGAMSDALMLSSATRQSFPMGDSGVIRPVIKTIIKTQISGVI